jgi:hypothetical protein
MNAVTYFRVTKMRGIRWLAEELLGSQEKLSEVTGLANVVSTATVILLLRVLRRKPCSGSLGCTAILPLPYVRRT